MQLNFWAAIMTLAICHCVLGGVVAFNLTTWLSIRKICRTIQLWNALRLTPSTTPVSPAAFQGDGSIHSQGCSVTEHLTNVADAKLAQAEHKLVEATQAAGMDPSA